MSNYSAKWSRRAFLTIASSATFAGTASAQKRGSERSQNGIENSIRIRFLDCEHLRIQGARVLNDKGYSARFSVSARLSHQPAGGAAGGRYEVADLEFPFEINAADIFRDSHDGTYFASVAISSALVRDPDGTIVTSLSNPDRSECLSHFEDRSE